MSGRFLYSEVVDRTDFLLRMSPFCWQDDCHDCPGTRCACACHDQPPRPPIPVLTGPRCRTCGYLRAAQDHLVICGDRS